MAVDPPSITLAYSARSLSPFPLHYLLSSSNERSRSQRRAFMMLSQILLLVLDLT